MEKEKNNKTAATKTSKKVKVEKQFTLITAFDGILKRAEGSELKPSFWRSIKKELDYLKGQLVGLTDFQLVLLAVMIDEGTSMSWKLLGDYFGCSRLSMMMYTDEVDDLIRKRWIRPSGCREDGGWYVGYSLERGVVTAIRHNNPFEPETLEGLTTQQLVDKADNVFRNKFDTNNPEKQYLYEWVDDLINSNRDLPLCQALIDMDVYSKTIGMLVVTDYTRFADTDREGLEFADLDGFFLEGAIYERIIKSLRKGQHRLFMEGIVEFGCDEGVVNANVLRVTDKVRKELLADYDLCGSGHPRKETPNDLKRCTSITERPLFYNPEEEKQIRQLADLLQPDRFAEVQQRLEERGMRKGFACLFYGGPGTGKTETALQVARQTGRDIMVIEIAGMRDKWVGESEKNLKAVFQRYKKLCKECERTPILFFNESDALINKRNEHAESSAEKMNNAMQNILLQELEDLDGILIATTNLVSTLDKAFERRFIYKIGFNQPNTEVKAKIWQSKIEGLDTDDAKQLAKNYDLSGGQIENIARKCTVDYVLYGKNADVEQLGLYCKNELLDGSNQRPTIGFV